MIRSYTLAALSSALAAIAIATAAPVAAHGIWLAQRADQTTVVYGHGAEDNAYEPSKVRAVIAIGPDGLGEPVTVIAHDYNATVAIPERAVAVFTTFDNGFWIRDTANEWQNVGKQEIPNGTESHHPVKFNTHVIGGLTVTPLAPSDATLQLVPQVDPTVLALGDTYTVQVLLNGEPLAGVAVINDYLNRAGHVTETVTDCSGRIEVAVTSEGLNLVAVEHVVAQPQNPNADELVLFATLSFVLPHVE